MGLSEAFTVFIYDVVCKCKFHKRFTCYTLSLLGFVGFIRFDERKAVFMKPFFMSTVLFHKKEETRVKKCMKTTNF